MSQTTLDITLHIDENTSHEEREKLRDTFLGKKGVISADYRDKRPHLMIVGFDPEDVTTFELVATASRSGYHTEMIAM